MNFAGYQGLCNIFLFSAASGMIYKSRTVGSSLEEIEIITGGRGIFRFKGEDHHVHAGDMLWFRPGETVEAAADVESPYHTQVIIFRTGKSKVKKPEFHTAWSSPIECVAFCHSIRRQFEAGTWNPEYFGHCVYSRLYWEAMEYGRRKTAGEIHHTIEKALAFIDSKYCEDISVEDIARNAGVSSPHLHLLFREKLNDTPMHFVMKSRLKKSENLLLMTGRTIKEIGIECGFNDINNFCFCFRKMHGISPGKFRKGFR